MDFWTHWKTIIQNADNISQQQQKSGSGEKSYKVY